MSRLIAQITAGAFSLFFITVVVIADRGEGDQWWAFLNHIPNGDKFGHIVLIGTLSLLCNLALPTRPRRKPAALHHAHHTGPARPALA